MFTKEEALEYHHGKRSGKIETLPSKPCKTQKDLTLAYSPGVAVACNAIAENPEDAWLYTNKQNLVGVISNGTAVLGLGNIGPLAGKPVMEGKGILFKVFADIDAYDINVAQNDPDKLIDFCKMISPTFGGINLEDIKAPECFYIEETLIKELDIPVFHDDQHGTAIITLAATMNSLEITGKKIEDIKIIISGAGAAAISCAKLFLILGASKEQIFMFDSKGLIHKGRTDLNALKEQFMQKENVSLADAMKGADLFLGLSQKDAINADMVISMAKDPIIFACANPDPEIAYDIAKKARPDCIMGTGRSDFPNQINNVLCFPFLFRGALDCRAKTINIEMKLAAATALAELAKKEVPKEICEAYNVSSLSFGKDYIIPKPVDKRILQNVASAVVEAAMKTGVASISLDLDKYKKDLETRMLSLHERIDFLEEHYK